MRRCCAGCPSGSFRSLLRYVRFTSTASGAQAKYSALFGVGVEGIIEEMHVVESFAVRPVAPLLCFAMDKQSTWLGTPSGTRAFELSLLCRFYALHGL